MGLPSLVLVLGGARSGKSRYAEALAERSGHAVTYVATAGPPRDAEMEERIAAHRARRPSRWRTVEAELDLAEPLRAGEGVLLLDCLTLWLSNTLLAERDIAAATDALVAHLAARRVSVVAVANEVGEGVVPASALGRAFRDHQGVLNQRVAREATHVVKMVAGCPVLVKPQPQPELTL